MRRLVLSFGLLVLLPADLHAQPVERFARAWTVDSFGEEPLFRPVELVALTTCEVWVSDAGNAFVYRWDCNGRPVGRVGGRGEGPGEFVLPAPLSRQRGDTVVVLDQPQGRISYFDRGGRFVRSEAIQIPPPETGFARGFGRASGTTVVHADNYPTTEPRPNERFSFLWPLGADGRRGSAVLRMPAPGMLIDRGGGASARIDAPFRRRPITLFRPDGTLLVGNTGSREFRRYRIGPRLVPAGTLHLDLPAYRVTRAERRAWSDSVRAQLASDLDRSGADPSARASFRERHERLVRGATFPATHPYYVMAAQDESGNLWLQLPVRRGQTRTRWQVRSGVTGKLLRTIEFTPGGTITAAAALGGSLFTIEVDGDGVASVSRYGRVRTRR